VILKKYNDIKRWKQTYKFLLKRMLCVSALIVLVLTGGRHGEASFKKLSNAIIAFHDIRGVIEVNDTVMRSCRIYYPEAFRHCLSVSKNVLKFNMNLAPAPRYFQESTFLTSFGSGKVMVSSTFIYSCCFVNMAKPLEPCCITNNQEIISLEIIGPQEKFNVFSLQFFFFIQNVQYTLRYRSV